MKIFLKYKAFLSLLVFVCAFASDSDHQDEGPPHKRIKLDDKAVLPKLEEGARSDLVWDAIKASGGAGCTFQKLGLSLRPSRRGRVAVLEAVVDAMFRRKVKIICDKKNNTYWYAGEMPQTEEPPMDIRVFVAQSVVKAQQDKTFSPAHLGYTLAHAGYCLSGYGVFEKIYESMRFLCCEHGSSKVQDFFCFLKNKTGCEAYPLQVWYRKYALARKKQISHREQTIINYIFDSDKAILQQIMDNTAGLAEHTLPWLLTQKVTLPQENHEESRHRLVRPESSTHSTQTHQKTPCDTPVGHLTWAVFEHMQRNRTAFAKIICQNEDLIAQAGSEQRLQTAISALRVLCYDGRCLFRKDVLQFVEYAQKKLQDQEIPLKNIQYMYTAENKCKFNKKHWSIAEYILSIPKELRARLEVMGLPQASLDTVAIRNDAQAQQFMEKVLECASIGWEGHYKTFVSFLPKPEGYPHTLKYIIPLVFEHGLFAHFSLDGHIFLSKKETSKPEPLVPMEVITAARFNGKLCSATERMVFANTVYQLGYPLESLVEFLNMFDAVCVARGVSFHWKEIIDRCGVFLHYIQNHKEQKSLEDYKASYPLRKGINGEEMMLTGRALEIQKNKLSSWNLSCAPRKSLSLKDANQERKDLIGRILRKYAEHKQECPYEIFDAFLSSSGVAENVLGAVMEVVFENDLNITYDDEKKTYVLHDAPNMRPEPEQPLWSAFVEHADHQQDECRGALAYRLYDAGYRLASYENVKDLQKVCGLLSCQKAKTTLARCKEFIFYALENITQCRQEQRWLYSEYRKAKKKHLALDEWSFAESLLRLYFGKIITLENVHSCFILEPEAIDFVLEAPHDDAMDVVPTDLSQEKIKDFHSVVCGAIQAGDVLRYQEIIPYVNGATTPEAVLEFVMDFVFKKGVCVEYDNAGENYKFLNKQYDEGDRTREEVLMLFMQGRYVHEAFTVRDRAECAYAVHVRGAKYASFKDFAQDFGAVCLVKNIDVQGMEDLARSKKCWDDMTKDFSCNGQEMFTRALRMTLFDDAGE